MSFVSIIEGVVVATLANIIWYLATNYKITKK